MAPSPATSPAPSLTPSEESFYNYYGFHRREELWSIPHSEADDGDDGDEPDEAGVLPMHAPAVNEITFNPLFRNFLIDQRMLAVAKGMLDTHVRISQTETHKGRSAHSAHGRSWHSDWPHDLSAYGPNDEEPWRHCGAVRQPFPDVCMALSTVWYLGPEDVSAANGGTWIVPRSHRDPRNPRGPDDGTFPIQNSGKIDSLSLSLARCHASVTD